MAPRKQKAKKEVEEKAENSPVITEESNVKAEPKVELVKLMNVTNYGKVHPKNSQVFYPNTVVVDVKMDNWIEVQVANGILKVVE